MKSADHSTKSILARGCDPVASRLASEAIPPLIGNPEYVPTTTDDEFIDLLRARDWSVVFFAPGACRFGAAGQSLPGSDSRTRGWTMADYRQLVREYQGESAEIVETLDERETVGLLEAALSRAG